MFIGCLAFGVFYSIISLIFSGNGFDHDIDHGGGFDVDSGIDLDLQHDGMIDMDQSAGSADAPDSPSPFNPLVLASAITAFGAVGLAAMKGFGMSSLMSTIVALIFSGIIGAAIFFGIVKFMYSSQSNTVFSLSDLVDTEAEVITPIPENGPGEIAYIMNGIRYTMTARSSDKVPIKRNARVIIKEINGNVAYVRQKLTLDDLELLDEEFGRKRTENPLKDTGNN